MAAKKNIKIKIDMKGAQAKVPRLKFLHDFMAENDLSTKDLADAIGKTRQTVYYWIKKDDVLISNLYDVFKALGYRIDFSLEMKKDRIGVNMQPLYRDTSVNPRRLDFMTNALKHYRIKKADLNRKMGLGSTTIFYWQTHDDCLFSQICDLAKATGLKIYIDIRPDVGDEAEEKKKMAQDTKRALTPQEETYASLRQSIGIIDSLYRQFRECADVRIRKGPSTPEGIRATKEVKRVTAAMKWQVTAYRALSVEADKMVSKG